MEAGRIHPATAADLDAIMVIVAETVEEMQAYGNEQWSTDYPDRDRFSQDIAAQSLYVATEGSDLCGFITVDEIEPEEYQGKQWRRSTPCKVIHRFAIASARRGQGWASRLETYALGLAREAQISYIKTDTHSTNLEMQRFLEHKGYKCSGTMHLPGRSQDYYCYDKILVIAPAD